jgi:hypothetical protein
MAMSNFVLDEVFNLIGRRAGYSFAAERARNIKSSSSERSYEFFGEGRKLLH